MLVAVGGLSVGKSSLINRIKFGSFSLFQNPTNFTEIHKLFIGNTPIILVETKDVIKCDVAILLCKSQKEIKTLWRKYCDSSKLPPIVVRIGENLQYENSWLCHEVHNISNLTDTGISTLIYCLYLKSKLLLKC